METKYAPATAAAGASRIPRMPPCRRQSEDECVWLYVLHVLHSIRDNVTDSSERKSHGAHDMRRTCEHQPLAELLFHMI